MEYPERFEIVRVGYRTDEAGDQFPAEEVVFEGWAKVLNLSGREYWEAFAVQQESTLKIHCRWAPALDGLDTRACRVRWRGRELDILSVDNIENRNELCTIKARERSNGGQ